MVRYALAPRWWFMHLVVAALFIGCVRLGMWQWDISQQSAATEEWGGRLRNGFYAFQWWFFACVGLWFWTRFLRDQREADERYEAEWLAEQSSRVDGQAEQSSQ